MISAVKQIGRIVKQLRETKKLTQAALASQVGVSLSALMRLELGQHDARASTLMKLAKALDVPVASLLSEQSGDERYPHSPPSMYVTEKQKINFERKVLKPSGNECWYWMGAKDPRGYGRFYAGGKLQIAHRVAVHIYKGPFVRQLTIDHTCRNRSCVNPAHLTVVSLGVNLYNRDFRQRIVRKVKKQS